MRMSVVLFGLVALLIAGYVAVGAGIVPPSATVFFGRAGGASGAAALFTGLTGVLVVWYLYETHLLRLSAELEYSPFLVLTFDPHPEGQQAPQVFVRNLGRGPAVSVSVEGLNIPGITGLDDAMVRLRLPAISPGVALPLIRWKRGDNYDLHAEDFNRQEVTIRYSDPAGRKYPPVVWVGDADWSGAFRVKVPG